VKVFRVQIKASNLQRDRYHGKSNVTFQIVSNGKGPVLVTLSGNSKFPTPTLWSASVPAGGTLGGSDNGSTSPLDPPKGFCLNVRFERAINLDTAKGISFNCYQEGASKMSHWVS
jgi:hypothetical protein